MTIQVTNIATRPSTDVNFDINEGFPGPEEWTDTRDYAKTTYLDTKKVISCEYSMSEDMLSRTQIRVYNSREDWYDFQHDIVFEAGRAAKQSYWTANGISNQVGEVN